MSKLPTRQLAFPNAVPNEFYDYSDGMELRDWFAGQALAGLLANPQRDLYPEDLAAHTYEIAEAMLKARKD